MNNIEQVAVILNTYDELPMPESNRCLQAGSLEGGKWDKIYESARRFYNIKGVSPTIHTMGGGNTEIKILVKVNEDE